METYSEIKRIFYLFVAIACLAAQPYTSVIGATEGTPINAAQHEYCFDTDRLIIGGYNYRTQYADQTHIDYVKDAGIEFLITSVNETFLDLCDQNGIGVIACGYNGQSPWRSFTDAQYNTWMNLTAANYKDHTCLWGDSIIDEQYGWENQRTADIVAHYYANIDGKIPFVNLNQLTSDNYMKEDESDTYDAPWWATADAVSQDTVFGGLSYITDGIVDWHFGMYAVSKDLSDEETNMYRTYISDYINKVDSDYLCVDIYPLRYSEDSGNYTKDNWLRTLDMVSEACDATNRDLWVITQCTTDYTERNCDKPEDIRWQAYTSLAFGAKAIIHACYNGGWWLSENHMVDADGNRTQTYYAVKTVNEELAAFADIYGQYEHVGEFVENVYECEGMRSYYITPISEEAKSCTASTEYPILVGCFDGENSTHAYSVVNMTDPDGDTKADVTLTFDDCSEYTVYRKGSSETFAGNTLAITLESCEGVYITTK